LDNELQHGASAMRFVYEKVEVIDQNPPRPGASRTIQAGDAISISVTGVAAEMSVGKVAYPPPPATFVASRDVITLWNRFQGLSGRQGTATRDGLFLSHRASSTRQGEAGSRQVVSGARGCAEQSRQAYVRSR
jgi:hypothetical protein